MSDRNSFEVAVFLERLARNWFIRNSLLFSVFGGLFNGLMTFGLYLLGLWGSSVAGWAIGLASFGIFVVGVFLAGVHYIVNRMHQEILGRNFNYLCNPSEYGDRSGA